MTAKKGNHKSKAAEKEEKYIDIFEHELVPTHEIVPENQKLELLEMLHVKDRRLPKILAKDPAVKKLGAKRGDLIRITRKSLSAGTAVYYRLVA
ncbi:MAG: DNA-directed RNA polymerase subunit H [Candidatus Aenigmarchaeota archaeon]|nr:DNA-directed RNA polymerase subunit H [Candidatus Aenigmarchaeota archaeon]